MNYNKKYIFLAAFLFTLLISLTTHRVQAENSSGDQIAKVDNYVIETQDQVETTDFGGLWGYYADVAPISEFLDAEGKLNVAYDGVGTITFLLFSSDYRVVSSYTVTKPLPLFGGAICDSSGNYYVVYGNNDETDTGEGEVIRVVKYNKDFKETGAVSYKGSETCTYDDLSWGTKLPFDAGNCSIAMNGNIQVCSYARQMYSGHQSNHVIYVSCDTMQKLNTTPCYTSHSFDQRVIVTSDGNYLFADHGDAYDRGFNISKVINGNTDIWSINSFTPFHFREGSNRDHGYNETYAQLGGIGELSNGYVLAGTSEETLSLDTAPTYREYCGDSEARNLFLQIFQKNFWDYGPENCQLLSFPVRAATGNRPADALTELWLTGDEKDYGVLWLTDYSDEYCAVNPKLIITGDDRIILLWEKIRYGTDSMEEEYISSYYMILNSEGSVLQDETRIKDVRLTSNEEVLYLNGSLLWCTSDGTSRNLIIHKLYPGETMEEKDITTLSFPLIPTQICTNSKIEPVIEITDQGKTLIQDLDYRLEYKDNYAPGKASVIIHGLGFYTGTKTINFNIAPGKLIIDELSSFDQGEIYIDVHSDVWYGGDGIQIEYALDKNFKNKKVKTVSQTWYSISGLKSKKTYYVRVRPYVIIDKKKVYGNYTSTKKVKVK